MSSMKRLDSQTGSAASGAIIFITTSLLLLALVFGVWAYQGRQDYKNNVDQKIAVAVNKAKQDTTAEKEAEFAEISKSPLRTWVGSEAYGAIHVKYPKTWSAYVISNDTRMPYIDGYFAPGTVPSATDRDSVFSLRVSVSSSSYSMLMTRYQSKVKSGKTKVTPYKLPKVPNVIGSKVSGELENGKTGVMVVLPLRANAIQIWTESNQYVNDFNKYILPNVTFSP